MTESRLIPCLRYEDAPAAINFLCSAFGFTRHAVYTDAANPRIIHHAQLLLGGAMIMLGSARPGPFEKLYGWRSVAEAGGITMSLCGVVADPDAHAAAARAAGADIIVEPHDNEGYPGRSYDVRDTEGNAWNFGSYDPFAVPETGPG